VSATSRSAVGVAHAFAAARAKGENLGRQVLHRPSYKKAKRVLELAKGGLSYRRIGRNFYMSKNRVMEILKRMPPASEAA
jgi:hypothetical protein